MLKKKSLGQHFLNPNYATKVADAAHLVPGELVLEVGPGEGVLTRELLKRGAIVVALEKDIRLLPKLSATFAAEVSSERLEVIHIDALDYDLSSNSRSCQPSKIVANIPYYITGALLRKFLSAPILPNTIVLLIQKEVAERIARSKKESILSLAVKAYGTPEYVQTVPRGAFSPAPKVDSAILRISGISRHNFDSKAHEERFFELLHAGFGQKRKLLKNNLEPIFGKGAQEKIERIGLAANVRAEDVPLSDWLALARE